MHVKLRNVYCDLERLYSRKISLKAPMVPHIFVAPNGTPLQIMERRIVEKIHGKIFLFLNLYVFLKIWEVT
jgi:hypothetical protein